LTYMIDTIDVLPEGYRMMDLLSFLPYWIVLGMTGSLVDTSGPSNMGGTFVKALRLLRIFRFEKYTHAFLSFDGVFSRNIGVLSITCFSALILWVLFGAFLYYTERNNPDSEMAQNYTTILIPDSMWMTLLNLSGEVPPRTVFDSRKARHWDTGDICHGCLWHSYRHLG
jgi:Ion transport protein